MLPIVLDPKVVQVGVAGCGKGLERKLEVLREAGVSPAVILDRAPSGPEVLSGLRILFVAGLDEGASLTTAKMAREAGVLVNVEDRPSLSDFHMPARVRRGDLLITVSTGGKSPALTRALREVLEELFGPEWDARLQEAGKLRDDWRAAGIAAEGISRRTRALMHEKGWIA